MQLPKILSLPKSISIAGGCTLIIRPFNLPDQSSVRRLILQGVGERYGFIDTSRSPDLNSIWETYVTQGHLFYIGEIEGNLAATGALYLRDTTTAEIMRITVSPQYRRMGIGRAMVQHLVEEGQLYGITRFEVVIPATWLDVLDLYRHCGFSSCEQNDDELTLKLCLG